MTVSDAKVPDLLSWQNCVMLVRLAQQTVRVCCIYCLVSNCERASTLSLIGF